MNRRMTMIWRVIIAGFKNFFRNAWLSLAAMAVMVITLTIILFSFIANATFNYTIQSIRDKIVISVYLKDDVTQPQREDLTKKLQGLQNVKNVEYVTKEQALRDYVANTQDNIKLQLAVSEIENPLPASLRIGMYDPDSIDPIKALLDQKDIKNLQSAETSYSGDKKEAIDNIAKATTFIRRAGIAGVVVFALISVLIIFNTIQMAIFNRRDELNIMRLLGASKWYVRGPFLVESFLIGISAAIISVLLCNSVFSVASNTLNASSLGLLDITYASDYFNSHYVQIVGIQVGIGVVIGVMSSYVATRRYLKFKTTK